MMRPGAHGHLGLRIEAAWRYSPDTELVRDVGYRDVMATSIPNCSVLGLSIDAGTYRTDLAQWALEDFESQGLDAKGLQFKKRVLQMTKGGDRGGTDANASNPRGAASGNADR